MSCPYFDWQKSCASIGKCFYTRLVIGSCSMSFFGLQKNAVLGVSSRGDCRGTGRGQYLIVVTKREIWGNFIQETSEYAGKLFLLSPIVAQPERWSLSLSWYITQRDVYFLLLGSLSLVRRVCHKSLTRRFFPFNCWHHDLNYHRCSSIFVYWTI